jgi:hypothetical protein
MATLQIIDLHVSIDVDGGTKEILTGVTLTINSGETHAIMGPNGSGKSTLAYTIAGHPRYTVDSGQILLDGQDVLAMSVDERARAGLFLAMQPALELLVDRGGQLGLHSPAHFFWATGMLSSFLDNAPTYLVFADVARAVTPQDLTDGIHFSGGLVDPRLLAGVSCGAVFMGANTYIGNGPNLMVAAIAREEGVPMPSFFGYMLWSGGILIPVFAVITFVIF